MIGEGLIPGREGNVDQARLVGHVRRIQGQD